jgi:hypothetical protein
MRRLAGPGLGPLVVLSAALAAGCASAQARTADRPLDVPVPPARAVEPLPDDDLDAAKTEPPVEVPSAPAAGTRPAPRPPAARPPRESRPEPSRSETAKPETIGPPAEARPPAGTDPGQELRTPQTTSDAEAARLIRDSLTRAGQLLDGINYRALNADAQGQYDTAKRFMAQADEALRARNFVFATSLAGKAETIARQLSGR